MKTSNEIINKWATLVAGSALLLNVASAQPQYNAVDIGSLGCSPTTACGINNSGQVVGSSTAIVITNGTTNMPSHAFLYSGCAMIDLGTLGGPMNNSGANA